MNIGNPSITANYCRRVLSSIELNKARAQEIESGLCDAAREGLDYFEIHTNKWSEDDVVTIKNSFFERGFEVSFVHSKLQISFRENIKK